MFLKTFSKYPESEIYICGILASAFRRDGPLPCADCFQLQVELKIRLFAPVSWCWRFAHRFVASLENTMSDGPRRLFPAACWDTTLDKLEEFSSCSRGSISWASALPLPIPLSSCFPELSLTWRTAKMAARTDWKMADVEQTQKMVPLITCEISLCQYVCVFDWNLGSKLILSNTQSNATL